MNSRWIGFVAARYISSRRQNRSSPAPVLAVLGIAMGVLALTVIIAVMNGFQMGFIESILEISSYHVRVDRIPADIPGGLEELPLVSSAVPFRELKGLVRGSRGNQHAALVRGLPPDALEKDRGMAAKFDFEEGSFDIDGRDDIILGAELARSLGVMAGDEIILISLSGLFSEDAENTPFIVRGIFRTGFYEYDLGWGFINLERAGELDGIDTLSLGIKLNSRWQDSRALPLIAQALSGAGFSVHTVTEASSAEASEAGTVLLSSWRDYNRAFFGALRTEKLLMFVLVGLIFIVVGLNIFQSQRRAVLERREEIGLLRAVGAADSAVRLVFTCDGFFIGLFGAGIGMALGLLIALNIQAFFTLMEGAVNGIIAAVNFAASLFGGDIAEGRFAVFSPTVFYIKEIPSRVIPHEAALIFMFGFLSAVLAAWFASGRVSRIRPAEVLRYE
ncbi:MAG: ABC transporter permease [Treponema sp.]|jgi:lipoprotein-releasing system permease protein|nr:ABC transporter permease [Treponema sp.]